MAYDIGFSSRRLGQEFEDDVVNTLVEARLPFAIRQTSGTGSDYMQGTDIKVGPLRVDVTLNFSGKDNMPFVHDTGIPATYGRNYMIGIRTGNRHNGYTEFHDPVIVLGADVEPSDYGFARTEMLYSLRQNASRLMDRCFDTFDEYTELDAQERACIQDTVDLRPNPGYREPRRLGARYQAANALQTAIIENGRGPDNMPALGE